MASKTVGKCPHCDGPIKAENYDNKVAVYVCPGCKKWVPRVDVTPEEEQDHE